MFIKYMDDKIIYDVDLANDVKAFVFLNLDDINFNNLDLRDVILKSKDDDLLRIGKTINSPITIVSVELVDADFFRKHLFTNGNQN